MADQIEQKVIAIIAEHAFLDPSDVTLDMTLDDMGLDSMALVEALFAFEEAFDITIPYNPNEPEKSRFDISTVGNIVSEIKRLGTAN